MEPRNSILDGGIGINQSAQKTKQQQLAESCIGCGSRVVEYKHGGSNGTYWLY